MADVVLRLGIWAPGSWLPKLFFGRNELGPSVKLCWFHRVLLACSLLELFPALLFLIGFSHHFGVLQKFVIKKQIPHLLVFLHLIFFNRNQKSLLFSFSYGRNWTSLRDKTGQHEKWHVLVFVCFTLDEDDRYHLFSFRSFF